MTKIEKQHIFAIIPVFNSGEIIKQVVIETQKYIKNIIIVDDGCDEFNKGIITELNDADIKVLTHAENQGKGFALQTGIDYALKNKAGVIIMLDSDGQHNPSELPQFIDFSNKNNFQLVLGVRTEIEKMPLRSKIGNVVMAKVFNLLYGQKLKDTQSGYRMMSQEFAESFLRNVEPGPL